MIPNVSDELLWLEQNPNVLDGINRGIERETLRITANGHLAKTPHAETLGSALAHPWITTDFAESLLEFITPVENDVDTLLGFLRDLHRYTSRQIGKELMWPLSMPCFIGEEQDVILAQYGKSNIGRMKTLYREGLKNRYGAMMQTISGVHYNFSLPMAFWQARDGIVDEVSGKQAISDGYFRLIRNYFRFGWVIPYLFGASPSMCSSFIKDDEALKRFEQLTNGNCYLPYATSLRMSDLGYTSNAQSNLDITFNHLDTYVAGLKKATQTPSSEFAKIGVKVDGKYRQLNSNVLQIENEFYAPIRPKRVPKSGESPSDALLRGGVQYIEVRALDVNPFTPIGIDAEQVRFLDLFLIWCALADAPEMSASELKCARDNWGRVILEGRKPGQTIGFDCGDKRESLAKVGKALFADLMRVAQVLDSINDEANYKAVCNKLVMTFDDPELTLSGRTLQAIRDMSTGSFGLVLAKQYKAMLQREPLTVLTEQQLAQAAVDSLNKQQQIEQADSISFDEYLNHHVCK